MSNYVTTHPIFRGLKNNQIMWRNFSGKQGDYNPAGVRNFVLRIDDEEVALQLKEEGWPVRWRPFKNDPENGDWTLKVNVRFNKYPPKIVIINNGKKSQLSEDEVNMCDAFNFEKVDLKLSPYNWKRPNGETGVSAYLESFYGTLVIDELEMEYEDVPDSALGSIGGCGCCDICTGECHKHDDEND